jgi:hypothetical protein
MPWIDNSAPAPPKAQINRQGYRVNLSWGYGLSISSELKYLVYRFEKSERVDLNNAAKILCLTKGSQFAETITNGKQYKYVVTALDRLWNESAPSEILE